MMVDMYHATHLFFCRLPRDKMDMENQIAEIAGDAPCPCGSKKPFKRCCMSKGHTYAYFGYGEHKFVFDLEETNRNVAELLQFTFDNIVTFHNKASMIEKEKGLTTLKVIYEMIDRILEPFLRNSSCEKGCNECCFGLIPISPIEAEMIRRSVMEESDGKHRLNIVSKVNEAAVYYPDPINAGEVYPDEVRSLYHSHHIPCPFLSEAGTCTVYGVRPVICRTHITFSRSDNCKANDPVEMYEAYYFPQLFTAVSLLSRLVHEDIEHGKHIGQWFLDEFRF